MHDWTVDELRMRIVFTKGVKSREREMGSGKGEAERMLLAFCVWIWKRTYTQTEKKITKSLSEEERAKELFVIYIISFKLNTFQLLMSTHINV